jgi:hypothetical protein
LFCRMMMSFNRMISTAARCSDVCRKKKKGKAERRVEAHPSFSCQENCARHQQLLLYFMPLCVRAGPCIMITCVHVSPC